MLLKLKQSQFAIFNLRKKMVRPLRLLSCSPFIFISKNRSEPNKLTKFIRFNHDQSCGQKEPDIQTQVDSPTAPGVESSTLLQKWLKQALLGFATVLTLTTLIVGGETRRKRAGLAMTSWDFFHEAYPTTDAEWEREFSKYQKIPEYLLSDQSMTLDEFKEIYTLEYSHRVVARVSGIAILVSSLALWMGKCSGDRVRAIIYSTMVCMQGLLGWYMVKSGFHQDTMNSTDFPTVSAYRLSAHNVIGVVLYSLLLHRFLSGFGVEKNPLKIGRSLKLPGMLCHFSLLACLVTIYLGGWVSGKHAIYANPTDMGSYQKGADSSMNPPGYRTQLANFFENPVMLQQTHKLSGYLTAILVAATGISVVTTLRTPFCLIGFISAASIACVLLQIHLGVSAMFTQENTTRANHQLTAYGLISLLIWMAVVLLKIKKGRFNMKHVKGDQASVLQPPPIPNPRSSK
ncbi:Cytochrome c oxidase assembly protein COX15 [Thelohanellus kitauei]|uniref:Cytochrome c oxidase assembly protein COX15 n=1 Tax=Thelohanellus kitauei TaxID=669202 RepID=A0A0C2IBG2_THEKT|nr:Cytochrome c oxidase assembly protein COX15 [Thelohanellus kitauei]